MIFGNASGDEEIAEYCAECGAALYEGRACQMLFDEFLGFEYTNPSAYGQVHFLTVACFMIQHGRYSDEALIGIQSMLRAYFDEQLTASQLRQRAAKGMSDPARTWKVTRRADAPPLPQIDWSMHITDVARNMHSPEEYCEQVRLWARAILQEMAAR